MTYRFKRSDQTVCDAVKRIAREDITEAFLELENPDLPAEEKVHQVRKRAKRLRGLFSLVRPAFADYARENAAIRDAARGLSTLRDAGSMVETYDKLIAATGARGFEALRKALVVRRDAAQAAGDANAALADFRGALEAVAARSSTWQIGGRGFSALSGGFTRTWARARADLAAAGNGDIEALHDWRKRVKAHWYHARLLRPIAPQELSRRARRAGELGEMLGDHHDLAVFAAHLAQADGLPLSEPEAARLDALVIARQHELEVYAQLRGAQLFALPAGDAAQGWRRWWKAWRKDR